MSTFVNSQGMLMGEWYRCAMEYLLLETKFINDIRCTLLMYDAFNFLAKIQLYTPISKA